jgi:hypothetical protein
VEEFRSAQQALLAVEREIAASKNEEHAVPLPEPLALVEFKRGIWRVAALRGAVNDEKRFVKRPNNFEASSSRWRLESRRGRSPFGARSEIRPSSRRELSWRVSAYGCRTYSARRGLASQRPSAEFQQRSESAPNRRAACAGRLMR